MLEKKTNIGFIINTILFCLYFFTILLFYFTDNSSGMNLNRNKIMSFNEGWTISYNNIIEKNKVLPQDYHLKPEAKYSIERTINRKDFIYPVIRIRSSMMDVHAYIDNQLIYSFDVSSDDTILDKPYPSSWQLINIPIADSLGKTLKITFSSPTAQFSGLINSVIIGRGEAIVLNLLKENLPTLIISILIIFLSIFALTIPFWIKKLGITKQIFYLSSFGIAAGFWIISESTLLQIFIPNRFVVSYTSYMLNLLLPLIITLFFRDIVLKGFKKLLTLIVTSIIILLVGEIILQLTGIVPLITSTLFSIIMIIITAFTILFCLIYEGYKKDNHKAKHYLLFFSALFIFTSIIIGLFIYGIYQNLAKYLALGVFGCYLLIMSDFIKSINDIVENRNKSLIYKHLAYEDYLTKGWNRTSFEQDIEKLISQKIKFRLVLLDLNHLKQINDTYGHIEGDNAIIESYNSIKETIKDNGKSYRVSGDEFAGIIYDTSNEICEKYKNQIDQILKEKSKNTPYKMVLAFGTKIYSDGENFSDFYKEVDMEMYKNKEMLKKRLPTNT